MLRKNKHSETLWGGPLRENSHKYWKKTTISGDSLGRGLMEKMKKTKKHRKNQKKQKKKNKKTIFEDSWLDPPIHQDLWIFCLFFCFFCFFEVFWFFKSLDTLTAVVHAFVCSCCCYVCTAVCHLLSWSSGGAFGQAICSSVSAPQLSANDRHPCFLTFPLQTFRCGRHPSQVHFCDDYGNGTRQRWPHGGGHWRRYPRGVSWLKRTGQAIGPNPSPAPWLRPDHTDNDNESEWVDIPEGDAAPQTSRGNVWLACTFSRLL